MVQVVPIVKGKKKSVEEEVNKWNNGLDMRNESDAIVEKDISKEEPEVSYFSLSLFSLLFFNYYFF